MSTQYEGGGHLGGADSVSGDVDDVVDAPGEPVVAVLPKVNLSTFRRAR